MKYVANMLQIYLQIYSRQTEYFEKPSHMNFLNTQHAARTPKYHSRFFSTNIIRFIRLVSSTRLSLWRHLVGDR